MGKNFAKILKESLDAMILFADQQIKLAQINPEEESVQLSYYYLTDTLKRYTNVLNACSRIPRGVTPRVNYLMKKLNQYYDELEKGPNKLAPGFWFNPSVVEEIDEELSLHPLEPF